LVHPSHFFGQDLYIMISLLLALAQQATPPPGTNPIAGCAAGGQPNPIYLMLAMVAVFYFMLIKPQNKKQREHQEWLKSLKKGDEVVTTGGVIGKISGLTDNTVTLEVQEKVRLKVLRSHITGKSPPPGQPGPAPAESKPEADKKG
jgi:preprotein translocase subunit YajC